MRISDLQRQIRAMLRVALEVAGYTMRFAALAAFAETLLEPGR
jgi:hypothetical protein